jgi:hypothetical protein
MRFAIRDDDLNFFTAPEEIEACYSVIWDKIPVSLSLISRVKGNWSYWVHDIYKNKKNTNWKDWKNDDEEHPIGENKILVQYLIHKLSENRIDLCFHACHHRNSDNDALDRLENNYVQGAEFYTNNDKTKILIEEIKYLKKIFDYEITCFTPPQNRLSQTGYKSVIKAGLNLCGGCIPFYMKEKTFSGILNIGKQAAFRIRYPGRDYPYVLKFKSHREIIHHYPLQPNTRLEYLIECFEHVRGFNGDFVLSTHYIEHRYVMTYNSKITMNDVFKQFIEHIEKYDDVQGVTLSKMLSK